MDEFLGGIGGFSLSTLGANGGGGAADTPAAPLVVPCGCDDTMGCLISGDEQGLGVLDWSRLRLSASGVPLVSLSADDGGRYDTFGAGRWNATVAMPTKKFQQRKGEKGVDRSQQGQRSTRRDKLSLHEPHRMGECSR